MRTLRLRGVELPMRGWHVILVRGNDGVAVPCPCCRRMTDAFLHLAHVWDDREVAACPRCASQLTRRRHEVMAFVRRLESRKDDREDWIAEGWKTSGRGNLTRCVKGDYVTIVQVREPHRSGWIACVGGAWSPGFPTAEGAMGAAYDRLFPALIRPAHATWMAARPY